METLIEQLESMKAEIDTLMERLDIAGKARRADYLEKQSAIPDFWSNQETAQATMREISTLKSEIDHWRDIADHIDDALELASLNDENLLAELTREVDALREVVERARLQALLSGPYDNQDAILAIHAGAGGTESQDWAEMLERMYMRWAADNGYKVEVIDRAEGEEAGIKSAMYSIRGDYAYGYLQSEQGVHRLVRISPYDAAKRRHTSSAKVELWPDIQGNIDIEVNEKDPEIETYRASSAGGQNVQKNETAIRIKHIPTGIIVTCQNQRSQAQNRERALQVLKARLFEMERKKRDDELAALKGENVNAEWGHQIRSYVLHPYRQVKDHRTSYEVGNTDAVLNGRLNDFMESYLRAKINHVSLVPTQEAEVE